MVDVAGEKRHILKNWRTADSLAYSYLVVTLTANTASVNSTSKPYTEEELTEKRSGRLLVHGQGFSGCFAPMRSEFSVTF